MLVSAKVQVKRIRSSTISCDRRNTTNDSLLQKNIEFCWKRMVSLLTNVIFCGMISSVPLARSSRTAVATPHCAPLRFACVGLLRFRAFGTQPTHRIRHPTLRSTSLRLCGVIEISCLRHAAQIVTATLFWDMSRRSDGASEYKSPKRTGLRFTYPILFCSKAANTTSNLELSLYTSPH